MILPKGFDKHDFHLMMKKEKHGRNRMRLLAMHHLQLGRSLKTVSELVQSHWTTVQGWLQRFRQLEFEGLFESPRSGAPRKIQPVQEDYIFNKIISLSRDKTSGYITGKEIHHILVDKYNTQCSLKTVYNSLHRLGFSWITSRSMHPKSSEIVQNNYKKNFHYTKNIATKEC